MWTLQTDIEIDQESIWQSLLTLVLWVDIIYQRTLCTSIAQLSGRLILKDISHIPFQFLAKHFCCHHMLVACDFSS